MHRKLHGHWLREALDYMSNEGNNMKPISQPCTGGRWREVEKGGDEERTGMEGREREERGERARRVR